LKLNNSSGEEAYEIDEGVFGSYDGIEDESDEDDAESSVDLFIRFLQSMFKKMSKRAKKASRSVLPTVISPQLVSFSFSSLLLLWSFWIPSFYKVVLILSVTLVYISQP
jgi:hypothetical protein